ncbi:hypothetical protein LF296_03030 [Acinetobacter vivianii]|uniref:Uncharacterized protein n=1 Tax=Acinetobacter vivianii TaxID=1776742 RepID=A0AAJ6P5S9_9GAMM|nr:hypothetical protein [Acinetobacter vivianii]WDZ51785.1 hypothetical protein LF296_03030 [Acinetobacter vivianii]
MPSSQYIEEIELDDRETQEEEIESLMEEKNINKVEATQLHSEEYDETSWEDNVEDED